MEGILFIVLMIISSTSVIGLLFMFYNIFKPVDWEVQKELELIERLNNIHGDILTIDNKLREVIKEVK